MDIHDLPDGQDWDTALENEGLNNSSAMVLIASQEALDSREVMNEINYALKHRLLLIPLVIRECKFPYRIERIMRIDATNHMEKALDRLVRKLQAHHKAFGD